jgi:hypothetical protein
LGVLAVAKNPTGQTVSLKKGFLHKLDFFIFSRSLPGALALMPLLLAARSPPSPS